MGRRSITALGAAVAVAASLVVASPASAADEPPRPIVSGWFGWWASDPVIAQMVSSADGVVGEVAMFWWSFQGSKNPLCIYDNGDYNGNGGWGDCLTGTSTPWTTPKFDRQRKALQAAGIKVNASITDLGSASKGKLSRYLSKPKNRTAYAKLITEYAVKAGVDGIDLDWEVFAFHDERDTWQATRGRWIGMVRELSKSLRAEGLTLWATVPGGSAAFTSDGSPNDSTGYWVYAWKDIAPYVDRLNIMTYDYSWSQPGAIGPNDWAERVAASAVAQVGEARAHKVWVGSPQYGRDWPVAAGAGWTVKPECPAGWKPNTTPVKKQEMGGNDQRLLAERLGVKPTWNAQYGEWTFQYWEPTKGKVGKKKVQCDILREVWFADHRSALARASIVPELRIGGIAVWQFDYVGDDFYSGLLEYGRKIAPAPTSVKVKATRATAHGRMVTVSVQTESRVGAAEGAEATLYFESSTGAATRAKVQTLALDAQGAGVFRVPAETSGSWVVSVAGSWARLPGESAPAPTKVRYAVDAKASSATVAPKSVLTLSGSVSPAAAGTPVTFQRRTGTGDWRDIATGATDANGAVSITLRPSVKGQVTYRLLVPESPGLVRGFSQRIVVTVT